MPAALCAKCRACAAAEGDSWCAGCTGWESLGRELTASWDSTGARLIASDLVVNAARQVRALRSLASGLARAGEAGIARAPPRSEAGGSRREVRPRHREEQPAPSVRAAKEEEFSEEEDEEETEERSPTPVRAVKDGDRRPPEPEGPPPGTKPLPPRTGKSQHREEEGRHRGYRGRDRTRSRSRGNRRGVRRAGRKHKRLYRLAGNPQLVVHRAPGEHFYELSSTRAKPLELGELGR